MGESAASTPSPATNPCAPLALTTAQVPDLMEKKENRKGNHEHWQQEEKVSTKEF